VISVPLVLWALHQGFGVVALAVIAVTTSILDSAVRVVFAYKLEPVLSLMPRWIDRSKLRPLFNYSTYTFIGRIADIFRFRLDSFVITAFVGLPAVTHYFVAGRLVEYLKEGFSQVIRSVTPVFSQDEGRNDYAAIRRRFLMLTRACLYLAVFVVSLGILYGRPFIQAWMGPAYADSYAVLVVLLAGALLRLAQAPATPLLYGISQHKYHTYTTLAEGLLNLALSLWLVRRYGMLGVAMGTAIPMTISALFVQPWYICRVTRLRYATYTSLLLIHGALATAFVLLGWLVMGRLAEPHLPILVLCGVVQTALFAPLAFFCGFSAEERRTVVWACRQVGMPPSRFFFKK
jgi:O-antigen/teichoic acid export membrane protein